MEMIRLRRKICVGMRKEAAEASVYVVAGKTKKTERRKVLEALVEASRSIQRLLRDELSSHARSLFLHDHFL
jgi:ribosome-binding factor A